MKTKHLFLSFLLLVPTPNTANECDGSDVTAAFAFIAGASLTGVAITIARCFTQYRYDRQTGDELRGRLATLEGLFRQQQLPPPYPGPVQPAAHAPAGAHDLEQGQPTEHTPGTSHAAANNQSAPGVPPNAPTPIRRNDAINRGRPPTMHDADEAAGSDSDQGRMSGIPLTSLPGSAMLSPSSSGSSSPTTTYPDE